MSDIFLSLILGLIQGVTEFLPISSSSHLVLLSELSNFPDQGLGFDIALHAGSLLAILIYFKDEIKKIFIENGFVVRAVKRDYSSKMSLFYKKIKIQNPIIP